MRARPPIARIVGLDDVTDERQACDCDCLWTRRCSDELYAGRRSRIESTAREIAEAVGQERMVSRLLEDPRVEALTGEALEAAARTGFEAKRRLLGRAVTIAHSDLRRQLNSQPVSQKIARWRRHLDRTHRTHLPHAIRRRHPIGMVQSRQTDRFLLLFCRGPGGLTTVMDDPQPAQRPYAFVRANDGALWANWWTARGGQWRRGDPWLNLGEAGVSKT